MMYVIAYWTTNLNDQYFIFFSGFHTFARNIRGDTISQNVLDFNTLARSVRNYNTFARSIRFPPFYQ